MSRKVIGRPPPPRRSALVAAVALQQPVKIHARGPGGRTRCGRPLISVATDPHPSNVTCQGCRKALASGRLP